MRTIAHLVKCKICGLQFDRDKVTCVKVSANRYAHKKCAEGAGISGDEVALPQKDSDLTALEDYIMDLFGKEYVDARVRKQIKEYKEQYNYTYSGMLKTLIYWYDIKGNNKEKANGGIGIVPYVYDQASKYYYALYLAQLANQDKNIEDYTIKTKIIEIFPPSIPNKPISLFIFDDEEE